MDPEKRLELIAAIASDKPWAALVTVGELILASRYPEDIFDGSSGDPGPNYIVALRAALKEVHK